MIEEKKESTFFHGDLMKDHGYIYVKTLQEASKHRRNSVFLCRTTDEKLVAIKLMDLKKDYGRFSAQHEIKIFEYLKTLPKHENIIEYVTSFETENYLAIVTEYVDDSQDLFDYINQNPRFRTKEAVHIFAQLLRAFDHLHSHGIAHRDVKPENILILKKTHQVKLLDFEFAGTLQYSDVHCGSLHYCSPEKFSYDGIRHDTQAADIWSLGVTFYVILTKRMPFDHRNDEMVITAIQSGIYKVPHADPFIISLFRCMLRVDPHKRSSIQQLKEHLIWKNYGIVFDSNH